MLLSEVLLLAREQRLARQDLQMVLDRVRQGPTDDAVNPPAASLQRRDGSGTKISAAAGELKAMLSAIRALMEGMTDVLEAVPSQTSGCLKSSGMLQCHGEGVARKSSPPALNLEVQDHASVQQHSVTVQRWRGCLRLPAEPLNSIEGSDEIKVRVSTTAGDFCKSLVTSMSNGDAANCKATDTGSGQPPANNQRRLARNSTGMSSNVLVERRCRRTAAEQPVENLPLKLKHWPSFRQALGTRRLSLSTEPCLELGESEEADSTVAGHPSRISGISEQQLRVQSHYGIWTWNCRRTSREIQNGTDSSFKSADFI